MTKQSDQIRLTRKVWERLQAELKAIEDCDRLLSDSPKEPKIKRDARVARKLRKAEIHRQLLQFQRN